MSKKTTAHCNQCLGDRNHQILYTDGTSWSRDDSICGGDSYELLKCCGCDHVVLKHTSWCSEENEPSVCYYPPAMSRKEPQWMYHMSGKGCELAKSLLKEIYVGQQNRTRMIATMGVRALMEHVMISLVKDHGTFAKNLAEFVKRGFISEAQRNVLEKVLDAGHATIHRGYQPSDSDLITCIDIAESVLQNVYVHPKKATDLGRRVPRRRKR